MNLSEYLNVLYPVIGGRQTKEQFIKSLILGSTFEPSTPEDKLKKEQLESYLDGLSLNFYDKIYNGHSTLGKKTAGEILRIFDKDNYCTYLSYACSQDSIKYIGEKFIEIGFSIEQAEIDDIIDLCANQFIEILLSIAFKSRKKTQGKEFNIMDLDPFTVSKEFNIPATFIVQLQRNRVALSSTKKRYTIEEIKNLHGA